MPSNQPGLGALATAGAVLAALLVAGLYLGESFRSVPRTAPPPTPPAAITPSTQPTGPATYLDLIRLNHRNYPATQPLNDPLPGEYAGHFQFTGDVYLDNTGRIWITDDHAPPTDQVLATAADQQVILIRQRVVYAHWMIDRDSRLTVHLVCPAPRGDAFELVGIDGRQTIGVGTAYDWARAFQWDQKIVVPTAHGASVFTIGRHVQEFPSPPLAGPDEKHQPVQIAFLGGPIAWIPPGVNHRGSKGAVRCMEQTWFVLGPEQGWPDGLLHLVPLTDGSVLQLLAGPDSTTTPRFVTMEPMDREKESRVMALIADLSDPEQEKRDQAYEQLKAYGPGLWPIAERMMASEPPETQARLGDLLRSRLTPLLGDLELIDGRLRVLCRYADGGALFYSDKGVSMPNRDGTRTVIAPAWLSVRPGDSVRLLPPRMVAGLEPGRCILRPWQTEWILNDETRGPRRFLAGEWIPLLRNDERRFSEFAGIGRGGRFVFRTPGQSTASNDAYGCLIIDPYLPDPTPRLPVWLLTYEHGQTGWDSRNWPAARKGGAWALGRNQWRPIDEKKEEFHTRISNPPPTTSPTEPVPLLKDSLGNLYYGGKDTLSIRYATGSGVVWVLPAEVAGEVEPHLFETGGGKFFLYNHPGRIVRLRPTPDGEQPFEIEAVFTQNIPSPNKLARMWLDPFERIVMVYDENRLAVLFPQGFIPSDVMNMMTRDPQ